MGHSHILFFLLATMGFLSTGSLAHHKTHIVGGSYGWKIPKNITFYQEWAQRKTFAVGDKLASIFKLMPSLWILAEVFLFTTVTQNVVEIPSEEDFAACRQRNVTDIHFVGPTILELTEPGPHYYFCSVGLHCEDGQKLSINVSTTPHPDVVVVDSPALAPLADADKSPATRLEYDAFLAGLCLYMLHALFM